MANRPLATVLQHLRRLLGAASANPETDGQLLHRFVSGSEEAAFTTLVQRHGPLVLGICRRVLDDPHDAEDAFQATFLVLVRKAGSVSWQDSIASWLYRVAYHAALKIRAAAARRRTHESQARRMPANEPMSESAWKELRGVLDEELSTLPDKYRAPLVLCYLQGKSNEEAARELGWPSGSMARRLAKGRDLLRNRLARRGLAMTLPALVPLLSTIQATAAVPPALAETAVKTAVLAVTKPAALATTVAAPVASVADALVKEMFVAKFKLAAAVLLFLGVVGAGTAFLVVASLPAPPASVTAAREREPLRLRHDGPVTAVVFTPDGLTLASGSEDCTVRLWDVGGGKESRRLPGHHHAIRAVACSANGTMLASAGPEPTLWLWDPVKGSELRRLTAPHGGLAVVAFSPDGHHLAAAGSEAVIRFWNPATGKVLQSLPGHPHGVTALAFAPDGKTLAVAGGDHVIRLWDLHSARELRSFPGQAFGWEATGMATA